MRSNRSPLKFIHAWPQGLFALALGRSHTRARRRTPQPLIDKNAARAPSAYLLFIIITEGKQTTRLYPDCLFTIQIHIHYVILGDSMPYLIIVTK